MSSPVQGNPGTVTANLELNVGEYRLAARMTVPSGPTPLRVMLPVIQRVADALVDVAVKATEEKGKTISCKAGCGACCRQLVPISETEARRIAELVEELPEPRRTAVRRRFADARRQLQESGMLDRLLISRSLAGKWLETPELNRGYHTPWKWSQPPPPPPDRPIDAQ